MLWDVLVFGPGSAKCLSMALAGGNGALPAPRPLAAELDDPSISVLGRPVPGVLPGQSSSPGHSGRYHARPLPGSIPPPALCLRSSILLLHCFAKGTLFILTGTLPYLSLAAESCRETGVLLLEIRPSLGYEKRLSRLASRSPCRMMRALCRIIIHRTAVRPRSRSSSGHPGARRKKETFR